MTVVSRFQYDLTRSTPGVRHVLLREKFRADRTGLPFSLVLLQDADGSSLTLAESTLQRLCRRIRITDDIGFLDRKTLAFVLSATGRDGAASFLDDIKHLLDEDNRFQFQIDSYPNDLDGNDSGRGQIDEHTLGKPILRLLAAPLPLWRRSLDVVVAILAIVCLLPILIFVWVLVRSTSRGPAIFNQRRTGFMGKPFTMHKLRTMVVDAESQQGDLLSQSMRDGLAFKMECDPRVTPVGVLLRKLSLDELPQLRNVLKGDMTLIGPRPLPCHESMHCEAWQRERLIHPPGLTCSWQVSGRSKVTFNDWMRMDVRYVRDRTIWTDVKLLGKTLYVMLFKPNGV